jgi:hypothetical protein
MIVFAVEPNAGLKRLLTRFNIDSFSLNSDSTMNKNKRADSTKKNGATVPVAIKLKGFLV